MKRALAAIAIVALSYACTGTGKAHAIPVLIDVPQCATEDGSDVDGLCVWIDPDTGNAYLNPEPMQRA